MRRWQGSIDLQMTALIADAINHTIGHIRQAPVSVDHWLDEGIIMRNTPAPFPLEMAPSAGSKSTQ